MARTIPSPTSGRTIPTPAATPGGGGGGTYSDWVEVSNDPGNDFWVRQNGTNGASITCELDSGNFKVTYPQGGNTQQKGSTRRGAVFVSKLHLDPWPNGVPSGETAGVYKPDACIVKVEIQFAQGYAATGTFNLVQLGLASYASDQGGTPGMPGDWTVEAGFVKNHGWTPGDTANYRFRAGYTGSNASVEYPIPRMKNQGGSFATGANALVWSTTAPIGGNQGRRMPLVIAPYNTDGYTDLWVQSVGTYVVGTADNSTKYGGKYVHLYLAFGSYSTNSNAGVLELSKIRYCVQSIANRKALPGA